MYRFGPIFAISLYFLSLPTAAQDKKVVDISNAQTEYLKQIYKESILVDHRFINGSVYQDFYSRANGHQFFLTKNWYHGDLFMNGNAYHQVSLKYDTYSDLIIYNHIHETGSYALILNNTRIDSFSIEGHTFCQLPSKSGTGPMIDPGFYEVISKGKTSLYQKWRKRYNEPSQNSQGEFMLFSDLYILNKGVFHKVSRKPGLVRALKDREKEIKVFIRENNILIGTGDEMAIKRVVDYYNSLH